LEKKSHLICYHAIQEAETVGEILMAHIPTNQNPANRCTKVLPGGEVWDYLISLLHGICDEHFSQGHDVKSPVSQSYASQTPLVILSLLFPDLSGPLSCSGAATCKVYARGALD
jgi:hypothetical protein